MDNVDIPNAKSPYEGVLCGGQPTPEALETAQRKGFKTIINLRPASEHAGWDVAETVQSLGLNYVNIPIAGEADLTQENVNAFHNALNDNESPTIVHCASGNRVGALFAMRAAWIEGKTTEEALEIGRCSGLTGMEPAVARLLQES